MNLEFNKAEDFLLDDSFLRYCTRADHSAIQYWESWILANPEKKVVFNKARELFLLINGQQGQLDAAVNDFRVLLQEHVNPHTPRRIVWYRWAAAAAILVLAGAGTWYTVLTKRHTEKSESEMMAKADVMPGSQKAQLVLGDGTTIELDSLKKQSLKEDDGTRIDKGEGKLVYDATRKTGDAVVFNTLTTPRGGEYQLVLPDGSMVWLNAASSLRFPTRFTGNERTVYLTGEAYFEVAAEATQPFKVQLENGAKIAVLGTSFNIMAYSDEKEINTTLVTGKVKVSTAKGNSVLLTPAQQAVLQRSNSELAVTPADIDKTIAWKSGLFEFDDDDISLVMRQLARWYDVDVKFTGPIPDKHYTGSIRKQSTLSQTLRILKTAGIQYKIEGKQIVVEVKQ
ncbi:FecR family protein [Chitinophaga silvatica]|uniref:FecR family protein n=1 Tax=Chitinophaga silvatica TaxID=2282649 RepID=A0A3E1Y983_9BACT|nr:FecR family protein [Chitinophaga silvatica]RFS21962.1 FecR family protein [Chitinophaga silvatica]